MIAAGAKPGNAPSGAPDCPHGDRRGSSQGLYLRNVAALAKPPRVDEEEVGPYTVEEIQAILAAAELVPNRARWAIALALGLRQGEVLGLRWPDVDLERVCSGCASLGCAGVPARLRRHLWSDARMVPRTRVG